MKNKKIVIGISIVIFIGIVITAIIFRPNKKNAIFDINQLIKEAEILNLREIRSIVSENEAKAEDYENKWYLFHGKIDRILEDECELEALVQPKNSSLPNVKVKLEKEILKTLEKEDVITVVGKLVNVKVSPTLIEAAKLEDEIVKNNLVMAVVSKTGTQYIKYTYSNYKYDKDIGKIIEYSQSGDSNCTHKLTYNDQGYLIKDVSEPIISSYGTDITTYIYNSDGTVKTEEIVNKKDGVDIPDRTFNYEYEKDSNGRVTKKTSVNILGDNYKQIFEYQYEGDKIVKEKQTSPHSVYIIKYEYDRFDNIIKEESYNEKEPNLINTVRYVYDIVAKK